MTKIQAHVRKTRKMKMAKITMTNIQRQQRADIKELKTVFTQEFQNQVI